MCLKKNNLSFWKVFFHPLSTAREIKEARREVEQAEIKKEIKKNEQQTVKKNKAII